MTRPLLDTVRHARHLLLPEIGRAGQERLLHARVAVAAGSDSGALAVAREYLGRAGVQVAEASDTQGATVLRVPSEREVLALAGVPELVEAARTLAGALAAVEAIKAVLQLGEPLETQILSLSSEEA